MGLKYKEFCIEPIDNASIRDCLLLFQRCFPNYTRSLNYLHWLYTENPRGPVIGFNAFADGVIAAHYACIPIKIHGRENLSLLSLNTATDPKYAGKGLFTELAGLTFDLARQKSFVEVIGVANANSVHGFTKKLNFQELGHLNLRFGNISRSNIATREFSLDEISWMKRNPSRKMRFDQVEPLVYSNSVFFPWWPLSLHGNVFLESDSELTFKSKIGFTIDWGIKSKSIFRLPKRFKPSPLTLIHLPLKSASVKGLKSWTYIDFDIL